MSKHGTGQIMRGMAWERAKGEMRSMLGTFHYPDPATREQLDAVGKQYDDFKAAMEAFVDYVDEEALAE